MEKEEKCRKMQLLKDFCNNSHIDTKELLFLFQEIQYASKNFPFEIYYEDGEICRRLDLSKNPVAIKLQTIYGLKEKYFWVSLKTSYPAQASYNNALKLIADIGIPQVDERSWRIPTKNEMTTIISNLCKLEHFREFFLLPEFHVRDVHVPDGRDAIFGCLEEDGCMLYYPGAHIINIDKAFWWPVCDAE